jgi:Flp pilus assembly protein TadD
VGKGRERWSSRGLWVGLCLLLGGSAIELSHPGSISVRAQGGLTLLGRVYLPDGQPASRAKVRVEVVNGFAREVLSDDQGNYEFRGVVAGRYRMMATHPDQPELVTEPAESDSTRSYANQLQIDLYFRLPPEGASRSIPPGTIDVRQMTGVAELPTATRKALQEARRHLEARDWEKARRQLDRVIRLTPTLVSAWVERGQVGIEQQRLEDAARDFAEARRIDPQVAAAHRGLGLCFLQRGQFEEAVGSLERAYALAPQDAPTLLLLGYGNLSLARVDLARQCLEEALRLDPRGALRAHVYLGQVKALAGDFAGAIASLRRYFDAQAVPPLDAARLRALEADWQRRTVSGPPR